MRGWPVPVGGILLVTSQLQLNFYFYGHGPDSEMARTFDARKGFNLSCYCDRKRAKNLKCIRFFLFFHPVVVQLVKWGCSSFFLHFKLWLPGIKYFYAVEGSLRWEGGCAPCHCQWHWQWCIWVNLKSSTWSSSLSWTVYCPKMLADLPMVIRRNHGWPGNPGLANFQV